MLFYFEKMCFVNLCRCLTLFCNFWKLFSSLKRWQWSHDHSLNSTVFIFSLHHAAHLPGPPSARHPPAGDPEPGSLQPHHRVDYQQPAAVPAPQWPLPHLWIPVLALWHLLQRPQRLGKPAERWGRADAVQADGPSRGGGREIHV